MGCTACLHLAMELDTYGFLQTNEDAAAFANRVRLEIAKKGGLVDIDWDPRFYPDAKEPSESRWRKKQQKVLSERIVGRKSESLQVNLAKVCGEYGFANAFEAGEALTFFKGKIIFSAKITFFDCHGGFVRFLESIRNSLFLL